MSTLLWACVLYLAGIAAALYIRPSLMFHADGEWKEFGFDREGKTPFPFWLFCIVWAMISYAILHFAFGDRRPEPILPIQTTATVSHATAPVNQSYVVSEPNRVTSRRGRKALPQDLRPGYYMLNESGSDMDGVPRYIFIGAEAPETSMIPSEDAS
jgi:hypothetical protein